MTEPTREDILALAVETARLLRRAQRVVDDIHAMSPEQVSAMHEPMGRICDTIRPGVDELEAVAKRVR